MASAGERETGDSLASARRWLGEFFDLTDPSVQTMLKEVQALEPVDVDPPLGVAQAAVARTRELRREAQAQGVAGRRARDVQPGIERRRAGRVIGSAQLDLARRDRDVVSRLHRASRPTA